MPTIPSPSGTTLQPTPTPQTPTQLLNSASTGIAETLQVPQGLHALIVPVDSVAELVSFPSAEAMCERIREYLGTETYVYPFLGSPLTFRMYASNEQLCTPYGLVPIQPPLETAAQPDTNFLGVDLDQYTPPTNQDVDDEALRSEEEQEDEEFDD